MPDFKLFQPTDQNIDVHINIDEDRYKMACECLTVVMIYLLLSQHLLHLYQNESACDSVSVLQQPPVVSLLPNSLISPVLLASKSITAQAL